jgi:hypothetical protein
MKRLARGGVRRPRSSGKYVASGRNSGESGVRVGVGSRPMRVSLECDMRWPRCGRSPLIRGSG